MTQRARYSNKCSVECTSTSHPWARVNRSARIYTLECHPAVSVTMSPSPASCTTQERAVARLGLLASES
jgi:hypothetical protein